MSTASQQSQPTKLAPPTNVQQFKHRTQCIASELLASWVGADRANEAIGRVTIAISASVAAARDPRDFFECTPTSVAKCIALAALTGLMPGTGSTALAYVIPQRARKDESPQLDYRLSHRGINALARRCGQTMIAVPVGTKDKIRATAEGEVEVVSLDLDDPPTTMDDLRGVLLLVKELGNGRIVHRGWVPRKLIEARRAMSRSAKSEYSPWLHWPIEMAIKGAMHYAIGRGWCVIDDTEAARALNTDAAADIPDAGPELQAPPVGNRIDLRDRQAFTDHFNAAPNKSTSSSPANTPASVANAPESPGAGAGPERSQMELENIKLSRNQARTEFEGRIREAGTESDVQGLRDEIGRADNDWLGAELRQLLVDFCGQRQLELNRGKPGRPSATPSGSKF